MSADSNYSQQPVPLATHKSALVLGVVMSDLTFFSASMWTDGTPGTDLNYDGFFLAVLLGNLMLGLCTAILGFIGAHTGLSTHLLAHYSFGSKGSWLPSVLLGGTQVGQLDVGIAMFAVPVAKVTDLDTNPLTLVSGALMTLTVFFSIAGPTPLSAITVPTIIVLDSYSVRLVVRGAGGLAALRQVTPNAPLSPSTVIALVIGSFVSASTLAADFVRFGRSARTTVVVYLVTFFLNSSLMFIFDTAGAAAVDESSIFDAMVAQGLLIPAILVLGLNIWTTNDNVLYASGLGFANITGLSNRLLAVLNDALDALATFWLYNHFVSWLTFLSTVIPPIGGVIVAGYLSRRRRCRQHPCADIQTINWAAILVIACGTAAGHQLPGVIPVDTVLGVAIAYLLLSPLLSRSPNKLREVLHTG